MARSKSLWARQGFFAFVLLTGSLTPLASLSPSFAFTEETGEIGLTLKGWEERAFQKILDRDGNISGPDWGILHLFHPDQDEEYRLDERTNSFSPLSDFRWYRSEEGLRTWMGSLNNPRLYVVAQVRERVPLNQTLKLHFSYFREESLEANRDLILTGLEKSRRISDPFSVFFTFHTRAKKASVDLEAGGRYRGEAAQWMVSVAFLDLFNDVTVALDRAEEMRQDEERDFIHHPYFLRITGTVALPFHLRGEVYGGIGNRTRFEVVHPRDPSRDYLQAERPTYWGGLLEWHPRSFTAAGVFTAFERAHQKRTPMGPNALDLTLEEKGVRVGSYLMVALPIGSLEGTLERIRRPEEGQDPAELAKTPPVIRNVRHRDTETIGGLELTAPLAVLFPSLSRLDLVLGYFRDHRKTGVLLPELSGTNNRLKLRFLYRFTPETSLAIGVNWDLDKGDGLRRIRLFDGGSAVLVALWK